MSLDPTPEEMRRLAAVASARIVEHLARLPQMRVAARHRVQELEPLVAEPLPAQGFGSEDCLRRFFDELLPRATLVNHPRFFAYVPGPGSFVGALAEWVAAATNLFVGTWLGGASMAQLEVLVLRWLAEILGLPQHTGILTTGGSMANLGALAAARSTLTDRDRAVLYASSEGHYSLAKAARVLGFAENRIRSLPVDGHQRLDPAAVRQQLARDRAAGLLPFCLCASAGTTSTGAIDPLPELAELCATERLWFHVDAAYGGAVAIVPEARKLLRGIERCDSITIDPHKGLYVPFECGCLLVRDVETLRRAFTADGSYLQDVPRDEVNFFERGPELSRGNRALKLWFVLRALGTEPIAAAVREDLRLCRLARELLGADPRIEIVTEPILSVFAFAVAGGEAAGKRLVERLLADGHTMLSSTRVTDRFVLRFCVVNHRTTEADIRSSVQRILGAID